MNAQEIENTIMAHRYLYYVLCEPTLPDSVYDEMERDARAALPESSPVHGVGSSLASSYSPDQVALAKRLLNA